VIWHTGLLDELGDLVKAKLPKSSLLVTRGLTDALNASIECLAKKAGTLLWCAMKEDAHAAVYGPAEHDRGPVAELLRRIRASGTPCDLHLLGHSAGAILNSHLLEFAGQSGIPIKTFSLLAPAITTALFKATAMKHIGQGRCVERLFLRTMPDKDEARDQVALVYRRSLLYLVSRAFEARPNEPLLGLARHIFEDANRDTRDVDPAVAHWLQDHGLDGDTWHRPNDADSTLHGSFDDDPATINDWMTHVLGFAPRRPYGGP
jgi:hypothetical protein